VQVLYVVQEALSNVRKHAQATHVRLDVWKQPVWRFQVRDDGLGFNAPGGDAGSPDGDTHVGLHIMRERAQRMGARLELSTEPGQGTTMTLTLAQAAGASPPPRQPAV